MRITTVFRRLLNLFKTLVTSVELQPGSLVLGVRPIWRKPRCAVCGRRAPGYDRRGPRRWRHLNLGATRIWLEYAPRRADCRSCGVHIEKLPWSAHKSRFTRPFEELTAYLAQVTDKTTVTKLMGISWSTVGAIVDRVVKHRLDRQRLEGLRRIGIDEFSYRKHHRYVTVVVDHDRRRIVWAAPGRSAATLTAFFEDLGEARLSQIRFVTIDMAGGYISAIKAHMPHAEIVYDRFHVQRLASDALDEVRRTQQRQLRGTEEGRALYRGRFALQRNGWNLSQSEDEKLSAIQQTNKPLYRAYLLNVTLKGAFSYRQPWRLRRELKRWMSWASRSKLKPFVKASRTIRKHLDGIVAYAKERLTNGLVEGFNNHMRMVARRAYGFHSPEALIAMMYLCCGGIQLHPPLP